MTTDHKARADRILDQLLPGAEDQPTLLDAWLNEAGVHLTPNKALTERLTGIESALHGHRETILELVGHPGFPPRRFLDRGNQLARSWAMTVWIYEALWTMNRTADSSMSPQEWHYLAPQLARTRFVLLSLPFRRGETEWKCLGGEEIPGVLDPTGNAWSWPNDLVLTNACRAARDVWRQFLDEQQSHVWLAQRSAGDIEADLRDLVLIDRRWFQAGPLALTAAGRSGKRSVRPTDLDLATATQVLEQHFLPRAMFAAIHRTAFGYGKKRLWPVAVALVSLAWLSTIILSFCGRYTLAAIVAAACYGAIGIVALVGGPQWTHPWFLRQPATAALGFLILITLTPSWWLSAAWWPGAFLAGGALGYLVLELRNHGVTPRWALGRGVLVSLVGLAHGFLVALLFLRFVAPTFAEVGPTASLTGWWSVDSDVPSIGSMLWLATSWCFAAGVFSQVLWDDKPITAPLSHIEWRHR